MLRWQKIVIRIALVLVCVISGFIGDYHYIRDVVAEYPTTTISKKELLDEEETMFKDFELDEDHNLVSKSIDPWIEYYFEESVVIEEINIVVDSITKEYTWGQVYNLDTEEWIPCYLHNGDNHIRLPLEWTQSEIEDGLRFDFTTVEDVVIDVEKVVLNSHKLLEEELHKQVIAITIAVLLALLTIFTWLDLACRRGKAGFWIGGAAVVGLQAGVSYSFAVNYPDEIDNEEMILCYVVVLIGVFLIQQLIMRSYIWKDKLPTANVEQKNKKRGSSDYILDLVEISEENITPEEKNNEQQSDDSDNQTSRVWGVTNKEESESIQSKIRDSILLLFIFALAAVVNFAILEMLSGVQFTFQNQTTMFFNIAICLEVILILYMIIRRPGIALIISNILVFVLALVNHYYFQFRGEPFEFASVIMADTAMSVMDNYEFLLADNLRFVILAELLMLAVSVTILCRKQMNFPKKIKIALILPTIALGIFLYCNTPVVNYWSITDTARTEGYVYSFVGYLKELGSPAKPEGYSVENAKKVLEENQGMEGNNTPDVIVIMNEAFADLPSIYDFETDVPLLPFIDSLQENTIKGEVLVSVFGGTTCNSEWEFLTGNSMAFMPGGSVPYMQYIQEDQQSLAHLLKNRGYAATGYHAYYKNGFHRDMVYPLMGFEDFYGWEDEKLPGTDQFRYFLSDKANYNNITYLYEKNEDASSQFIFNVTMQNHGGYSDTKSAVEVTVQPADESMRTAQLQEYLSLMHESDEAFKQLVEYYQNVEKDTIILMFGDHQPGLGTESYNKMDSRLYAENATLEDKQKQYRSSFVIWANFDIEEQEDVFISANYLRSFLLQTAGMELSSYDKFLLKVREKYPAISAIGYCDKEGKWYETSEMEDTLLKQYSWLNYYNVFDKKKLESKYYTK